MVLLPLWPQFPWTRHISFLNFAPRDLRGRPSSSLSGGRKKQGQEALWTELASQCLSLLWNIWIRQDPKDRLIQVHLSKILTLSFVVTWPD